MEPESRLKIWGSAFAFPPEPRQHWASRAHEKGQSKSGLMQVVVCVLQPENLPIQLVRAYAG